MVDCFIGLGSNIGNKEKNISHVIELIEEKCEVVTISSLYETQPVGFEDQDWFVNCVIQVEISLGVRDLLAFLQGVEEQMGRKRVIRNGPRIIDCDILLYGEEIIEEKDLVIPHPRMHDRRFVLEPLCEIAPGVVHPVLKKTAKELLSELTDSFLVSKHK